MPTTTLSKAAASTEMCEILFLFYTKSNKWTWNWQYTEYDSKYVDSFYKFTEEGTGRRYRMDNLTAAKPGGDTSYEWRVKRLLGGYWEADLNDEYDAPIEGWEYKGALPYRGRYWAYSKEKMIAMAQEGRIAYTRTGTPCYKRYLDEMLGVPVQNDWTNIMPPSKAESMRYPTQKPLALLERIVNASSNEGDVVLDPFCGCATALIAAEKLERQWIGIDLSPKARELVSNRMERELGLFGLQVVYRDDVPRRTDMGLLPPYQTHKHTLYGIQEGICAGCEVLFPFRNFTVDHIVPKARGGTDHIENLQMLCNACNSVKGTKTQAEFLAALRSRVGGMA